MQILPVTGAKPGDAGCGFCWKLYSDFSLDFVSETQAEPALRHSMEPPRGTPASQADASSRPRCSDSAAY